jgi:hypothetical protein
MDECPHEFATLASAVLPALMAELRDSMAAPISMSEFRVRGDGPMTIARRHGFSGDVSGCYVFTDSGQPVYVGISRHVFERLAQHVECGDHFTATLAYRMAAADAPHAKFAADAMKDPAFRAVFDARRDYLAPLQAAVVVIANPLELYLSEAYAAIELDTCKWSTFATH